MTDAEIRDATNRVLESIAGRESTDIRIPPSMVALIMITYVIVTAYYVASLYSRYEIIPPQQMFTMAALFAIGAALVIAMMYTLTTRNTKHSKRESELRASLIEYAELNNHICGYDLTGQVEGMKNANETILLEERMDSRPSVIPITIPVIISLVLLCFADLREHLIPIIAACYVVALVISVLFNPNLTRFPRQHDVRSKGFYEWFDSIAPYLGIEDCQYVTTIGYRSFWLFLFLSIITAGLFLVYWVYLMFRDMNRHFDMQWAYEDNIFRSLRKREKGIKLGIARRGKDYTLERMLETDDIFEDPVFEEEVQDS